MEIDKSDINYIKFLIASNDRAVERAILAIYNCQTDDEKSSEATKHSNGRGFSGSDARLGSYWARWILSGKNLTGNHLLNARKMAIKYSSQLSGIVKEKMKMAEGEMAAEREAIQSEGSLSGNE